MADPDLSVVTFLQAPNRCTNCGYEMGVQSVQSLPPCPKCSGPQQWQSISGRDSASDPYPQS